MAKYVYEYSNWTDFIWEEEKVNPLFGEVRMLQGKLIGRMEALGFLTKEETVLNAITLDVLKSSEIEGEILNKDQVRSSIARRLGLSVGGLVPSNRHIEGIVEMMLNATQRFNQNLTHKRLFGWHAALFPNGYSGPYKIEVGKYRSSEMQIVSGAMGKEKVHYQAISPKKVKSEMERFLEWINAYSGLDPLLKAAVAHFWFIIIHPFDDGNGRIGRAIADLLLSRSEGSGDRYYSMSNQILLERKSYYQILQSEQHSDNDITQWMVWFLQCLKNAILSSEQSTINILKKAEFWKLHEQSDINERQRKVINKLFDGFEGKLQTSKWAKITRTSNDTALRDIKDLIKKDILVQMPDQGRNACYELKKNP